MLSHTTYGAETLPKLLMVHGLYGQGRNWAGPARDLSDIRHVTTVDLRNHGDSPWAEPHDYPSMAADLEPFGPADVLGHSMGGKAAMTLALTRPDLVNRLIVADIAPVPYDNPQMQYIEAMKAVDLSQVDRRSTLVRMLGVDRTLAGFLSQNFDMKEKRWTLNLDALARGMDDILSFPQIDAQFTGPTLFLTGADSRYVLPEYRDQVLTLFPNTKHVAIPGAGHWLHADQPEAVVRAIRRFLS